MIQSQYRYVRVSGGVGLRGDDSSSLSYPSSPIEVYIIVVVSPCHAAGVPHAPSSYIAPPRPSRFLPHVYLPYARLYMYVYMYIYRLLCYWLVACVRTCRCVAGGERPVSVHVYISVYSLYMWDRDT